MNTRNKPILLSALLEDNIQKHIPNKAILGYSDGTELNGLPEEVIFMNSGLKFEDIKVLVDNNAGIINHINDSKLHWSPADRREYTALTLNFKDHIDNNTIHITIDDRKNWDGKETEAGAQAKANAVQTNLEVHAADLNIHTTKRERDRWNNTYTREETANLVSNAHSNSVWKDAVDTYDDLVTTYPNPSGGWVCTVLDTNITYSYDEKEGKWVTAFINTMPLATEEINGLLSKELYIKIKNIEPFANNYIHPDNTNCRHVTDLQIKRWDNKAGKDIATIFAPGLMHNTDKEKLDTIERYANNYTHPEFHSADIIEETPLRKFVTQEQIDAWSNPVGVMASETQDGAMSKEMYIKLAEIEDNANYYVHPKKHSSTDIAQDTLHRFVTDEQIALWTNKEESTTAQARVDQALQLAKEYTDQTKSDLLGGVGESFDTLKELADALGNDNNLSTTILTELSNKVDKIDYGNHINDFNTHLNNEDRLKLNSVDVNANYYIHPDTHPASMIVQSSNYRLVTDGDISLWNSKAPGTVATPLQDGIMSKEYAAKLEAITETGKVRSNWLTTDETADSYILNKPTKLPADGGNADTIEGYRVKELKESNKYATIIVGCSSSGFTDKNVDFVCDGTNDVQQIRNAFSMIPENGGSILFKEGTYHIDDTIVLDCINTKIEGSYGTIFKNDISEDKPMIHLSGIHNIISDIIFDNTDANILASSLYIDGNQNIVTHCQFTGNTTSIRLSSSNYNKIMENDFINCNRGIIIESPDKDSYGNIVSNNSISECTREGILLMSSLSHKVSNTILSNNVIYNAYTGIRLTNEYMTHNTINTTITGNNIMRGTGLHSDYLYEQRNILIEYGSFNLIANNTVIGYAVVDKTTDGTNLISNNLSVIQDIPKE